MPNPSLSSFISSNQYNTETVTVNRCIAGLLAGSTYVQPGFSATSGSTNDPGGLFGWLIYSRSSLFNTPAKGTTADTYLVYGSPSDLVGDLNKLGGVTYCLVSTPSQGGTFGFFLNTNNSISGRTAGVDFLYAVNYLAYGGILVISGTTTGFNDYESATGNYIDVLIGTTANTPLCGWLNNKDYTVGIFPSIGDDKGQLGAGYTMANYASFTSAAAASRGTTFSNRVFNIYGVKGVYDLSTDLLATNSKMSYILPAVSDVAGFFTRAKNKNTLYLSVAGSSNATLLNGIIANPINVDRKDLKLILKNNRVNYFINASNSFLGQDLVGATASTDTVKAYERIGVSELNLQIQKVATDLAQKYLFQTNNEVTRSSLVTEINSFLNTLTTYIDMSQTTVICDTSNGNADNGSVLYVTITFKPYVSSSSTSINVVVGDEIVG